MAEIETYRATRAQLSHRERALCEEKIWAELTEEERRRIGGGSRRSEWLAEQLGGSDYEYRHRYTLYYAAKAADLLWQRIEQENMPLGTAVRLLKGARHLARERRYELAMAVQEILSRYDEQGGAPTGMSSQGQTRGQVRKRRPVSSKSAWQRIGREINALFEEQLAKLPAYDSSKFRREFEADLRVLVDSWQGRLFRSRRTHQTFEHREILDACDTLGMDPPDMAKPADLRQARRQQRRLGRLYHPDACGDEALRPRYEAVNRAYTVLETYNESLASKPPQPQLSVIDGGKKETT